MSTVGLFQVSFFIFIMSLVFLTKTVVGETYAECEDVPERTFTGHSKKCSGYIFCNGEESFEGECEDGEYFNADDGVCDAKEFVDCKLDETSSNSNETFTTSATTTRLTTSSTLSTFVTRTTLLPSPPPLSTTRKTTVSTVIASTEANSTNSLSTSENTQNSSQTISTNFSTTSQSSTSPSPSTTPSTSIMCPHVENPNEIIFLSHKKSCSAYYVCINDTPIEMFCSRMLHFNVKTGKCDYPENVKCLSSYSQPKEQCRRHIVDYYPHTDNCNYYYLCQSGFLMLEQCPLSYGWDIEKRTCVALSKAKCFNQPAI